MKKISKRIIALMLASSMVVSMTACGKKDSNTTGTETPVANTESTVDGSALAADALVFDATADAATYADESASTYAANFSEFTTAYEAAKATDNLSERFALMAIAEAKLMETAAFPLRKL